MPISVLRFSVQKVVACFTLHNRPAAYCLLPAACCFSPLFLICLLSAGLGCCFHALPVGQWASGHPTLQHHWPRHILFWLFYACHLAKHMPRQTSKKKKKKSVSLCLPLGFWISQPVSRLPNAQYAQCPGPIAWTSGSTLVPDCLPRRVGGWLFLCPWLILWPPETLNSLYFYFSFLFLFLAFCFGKLFSRMILGLT